MTADSLRRESGTPGKRGDGPGFSADDEHLRWSEFQSRLRRYVATRVDSPWADDVTSDILLRLLKNRHRLEQAHNPSAWAYRVAANAITDHYRRRAVESRANRPGPRQWSQPQARIRGL